ncbi:MAG: ATP-binding protein [Ferruginibacter sp.]
MAKVTLPEESLLDNEVWAKPTKGFFVTMLTRDIALMDAIMDLIDNCIDGIHREAKKNGIKKGISNYKGFHADINLNEKEFILRDNCGGIPLNVAKNYAFKMGRSTDYHDDDKLETLGMYGIGMKRGIFKMGLKADVTTWNNNDIYKVKIPEDWAAIPKWVFEYENLSKSNIKGLLTHPGTRVHITALHKNISKQFKDTSGFVKDLKIELQKHYGYIIQQGFSISLNGVKILSLELNILTNNPKVKTAASIKPYVYAAKIDDVNVEVMIGFYRPPASEDEIQKELDGSYASSVSENAGITVLCNDRVVLYCDKTFLTGWGETPVPKYHTQFIAIAGVIHFRSNDPIKLPVTTTKRGLDTSSAVYAAVKNKVKEGLRLFTSFTNNWKTPSDERTKLFKSVTKINALRPGQSKSALVTLKTGKKGDDGEYQIPELPKPSKISVKNLLAISFTKDKHKVEKLKQYFFEEENKSASEIGSWCFDKMYSQVD